MNSGQDPLMIAPSGSLPRKNPVCACAPFFCLTPNLACSCCLRGLQTGEMIFLQPAAQVLKPVYSRVAWKNVVDRNGVLLLLGQASVNGVSTVSTKTRLNVMSSHVAKSVARKRLPPATTLMRSSQSIHAHLRRLAK